jgi:thioredoxin-dependent peroxiredoxin
MLAKGDKAPGFSAFDQNGNSHSLSDFTGKKVVLYFYPKDDTPGCTKEACNLRDNYQDMLKRGFVVLGVSPDSVESHSKFALKYELPFPLLADPEMKIIKGYGAWGEKKMYGKSYEGLLRTTFIINEEGLIDDVITKVNTDAHAEQIFKRVN